MTDPHSHGTGRVLPQLVVGSAAAEAHLVAPHPAATGTRHREQGRSHRIHDPCATGCIGTGAYGQGLRIAGQGVAAVIEFEVIDLDAYRGHRLEVIDAGLRIHAQITGGDTAINGGTVIHGQLVIGIEITVKLGAVVEHHVVVVNPYQTALLVSVDVDVVQEPDVLVDKDTCQSRPRQPDVAIIYRQLIDIVIPLTEQQGRIVSQRDALQQVCAAAGEGQGTILSGDRAIDPEGDGLLSGLADQRVGRTDGGKLVMTEQLQPTNVLLRHLTSLIAPDTIVATRGMVLILVD
ncbi:hypothetical protein D3C85_1039090 [compost metagenome]